MHRAPSLSREAGIGFRARRSLIRRALRIPRERLIISGGSANAASGAFAALRPGFFRWVAFLAGVILYCRRLNRRSRNFSFAALHSSDAQLAPFSAFTARAPLGDVFIARRRGARPFPDVPRESVIASRNFEESTEQFTTPENKGVTARFILEKSIVNCVRPFRAESQDLPPEQSRLVDGAVKRGGDGLRLRVIAV